MYRFVPSWTLALHHLCKVESFLRLFLDLDALVLQRVELKHLTDNAEDLHLRRLIGITENEQ